MAKKPITRPPAEAAKPPPAAPAAAEAAAPVTQPGAGTEGSGQPDLSGSGASSEASSSDTGPAAPASVLGGAGEDVVRFTGAVELGRRDLELADPDELPRFLIEETAVRMCALTEEEWVGLGDASRDRLVAMVLESMRLGFALAQKIRTAALAALAEGDLVELTVRSRDGKPFRRAGFVFGDAYQTVHATPAQAERIRADRGCQVKA